MNKLKSRLTAAGVISLFMIVRAGEARAAMVPIPAWGKVPEIACVIAVDGTIKESIPQLGPWPYVRTIAEASGTGGRRFQLATAISEGRLSLQILAADRSVDHGEWRGLKTLASLVVNAVPGAEFTLAVGEKAAGETEIAVTCDAR